MRNITFLTGAGISQESGLETFRDSDGLWNKHDVYEVASVEAWEKNPELCRQFYAERRKKVNSLAPNEAHNLITDFQRNHADRFHIDIITQNIDNYHERSGSKNVLHLHGNINEVLVETELGLVVTDYTEGLKDYKPHVVMFGEEVPNMIPAIEIMRKTDYLIVVGTSLTVYPANSLVEYTDQGTKIYNINPVTEKRFRQEEYINEIASVGLKELLSVL